jgi:hypothetical protein
LDLPGLQRLSSIAIPPGKKDSGSIYLKRAINEWKKRLARKQSAILDSGRRTVAIARDQTEFRARIKGLREEAIAAVEGVRQEAERAVANLNDLFVLGRKGIEAQMRAHLDGTDWQGEQITSSAFRECFRMVAQAVKGLGLPSEQRGKAAEAVIEEVAASLRDTQEAVALAADDEKPEVEH